VRRQRDDGVAVLISSHVLSEVELLSDQVVVLAEGRTLVAGATEAVLRGSTSLEELFFGLTSVDRS
jgi:ABC-2 type transport system ATP-binding protein